jgi:hypothetical protein
MGGFLDRDAPSLRAEYLRYVEKDILGKILFKNFFLNVLNFPEEAIYIPLGRSSRYDPRKLIGDAQILEQGRWLNAEIKCAYKRNTHLTRPNPLLTWGFDRVIHTAKKNSKSTCDFVFAVGINTRCLGDPAYWTDFNRLKQSAKALTRTQRHTSRLSCLAAAFFFFPTSVFPEIAPP